MEMVKSQPLISCLRIGNHGFPCNVAGEKLGNPIYVTTIVGPFRLGFPIEAQNRWWLIILFHEIGFLEKLIIQRLISLNLVSNYYFFFSFEIDWYLGFLITNC